MQDPTTAADHQDGEGTSATDTGGDGADQVDPLDEAPPTTPRGSLALTVVGFVLAVFAFLPTGLTFVVGPAGMACGLVAHLKGRRAGFAAAVLAAVGTVVGLSVRSFMDIY